MHCLFGNIQIQPHLFVRTQYSSTSCLPSDGRVDRLDFSIGKNLLEFVFDRLDFFGEGCQEQISTKSAQAHTSKGEGWTGIKT